MPQFLAAVDPNMTKEGARRIADGYRELLPKLRRGAKQKYIDRIAAIEAWIAA
jgi:hypothetical protein